MIMMESRILEGWDIGLNTPQDLFKQERAQITDPVQGRKEL